MSKDSEDIVDATPIKESKKAPPVKSHFGRNLLVLFIIAGAVYFFFSDLPAIKSLKSRFSSDPEQSLVLNSPLESTEPVTIEETPEQIETAPHQKSDTSDDDAPIFEQDLPLDDYSNASESDEQDKIIYEDLKAASAAIADLQQQIETLQHTVNLMHTHQVEQGQQMVSAKLFALLQQAAVKQENLLKSATLWKSISFLPLLSDEKRDAAQQGYEQLRQLHHSILATASEIDGVSTQLQQQITPEPTAATEAQLTTDPYQTAAVETGWSDWLIGQFKLSKVDPETRITPKDPYVEQKQLIRDLQKLKTTLVDNRWQDIGTLNKLFYQLEQRGIETSFDHETIHNFEQVYQTWQTKAEKWMEQL